MYKNLICLIYSILCYENTKIHEFISKLQVYKRNVPDGRKQFSYFLKCNPNCFM